MNPASRPSTRSVSVFHLKLGHRSSAAAPCHSSPYRQDGGDFAHAMLLPVAWVSASAGRPDGVNVMCPSSHGLSNEESTPLGDEPVCCSRCSRATSSRIGWRSPEVKDALDLCLACKGCTNDCPVDEFEMPMYKAEFLHHHWKGRLRPSDRFLPTPSGLLIGGPVGAHWPPARPPANFGQAPARPGERPKLRRQAPHAARRPEVRTVTPCRLVPPASADQARRSQGLRVVVSAQILQQPHARRGGQGGGRRPRGRWLARRDAGRGHVVAADRSTTTGFLTSAERYLFAKMLDVLRDERTCCTAVVRDRTQLPGGLQGQPRAEAASPR